ncbi:hypothetical protein DL764_004932 [Monosporascus ibericus]|uniref:Phenylalanine ammonia-lyase n=1 Tax=Monosporascus ibericus TaxID=155417 RepID=A0A4Q4TEC8_9PEZI|nr:hypothetical protein DL764_004932 [Monosporascus ibericus]
MYERPHPHFDQTKAIWECLERYRRSGYLTIDGHSLDIAGVVAVSRHACKPSVSKSPDVIKAIDESIVTLNKYLADGSCIYGVNTGFGGSADVRTAELPGLQVSLIQHTQSAVMINNDTSDEDYEELRHHVLPRVWVKGSMIVRANANIRGHSAMKLSVAEAIVGLVRHDCTPFIPLRGTISASGDLMPLSYVAGSIMGNPDVKVQIGKGADKLILPADKALRKLGMEPTVLGPKEGLSLINGTAPSAAVASLAIYETNNLAVTCQLLTAMTAEGLAASVEWAHPFISDIRPHRGQIEAASNIRSFLVGSKLVTGLGPRAKDRFRMGIAQERYALRTSPQWLSPVLEDLMLAQQQVEVELNSTTDNPLVNVAENDVHSGGNFQAASITSAAEKMRFGLQMMGKLLFSQTTELINNALSNGLPPNLAADDPSLSFCLKGVDVNMAAYQSELAFLANPISSHVQSAEMHNQSVNSLALLNCRYTMQAVELVSLMSAGALYTTCQALDLRVMHMTFLEELKPVLSAILCEQLAIKEDSPLATLVWKDICKSWYDTSSLDTPQRASQVASATVPAIAEFLAQDSHSALPAGSNALKIVQALRESIGKTVLETYVRHRDSFFKHQTTAQFLGSTTRRCYEFVRKTLGVPFHRGLVEQPAPGDTELDGRPKRIIGSWVSTLYEAIRDGRLVECILRDGQAINGTKSSHGVENGGLGSSEGGSGSAMARKELAVAAVRREQADLLT